jgi:predicted AlkP superfamily phosphohydrolase/phosphomutase
MTYPPDPFPGVEISGWATHDHLGPPSSHPPGALRRFRREGGRSPIAREIHGPQRARDLLVLARDLVRVTRLVGEATASLARREPWDLFLVVFGAAHRGGHKLWDETCAKGRVSPGEREALRSSLREVYAALDGAVGSMLDAAGEEATVLVFSVHGMGANNSREILLPEMLRRVLARSAVSAGEGTGSTGLAALRGRIPLELRRAVKKSLPVSLQDRLTAFWAGEGRLWKSAEAFSLPADHHGYVRINTMGREAAGTVPEGAFDALCDEIAAGLGTFRDSRTGEPCVADVVRTERCFPVGARSGLLPDLVVRWAEKPASGHEAIVSVRHGRIAWPAPGKSPGGRSGNHRGEGFVIAAGPGVPAGARVEGGSILDLAPTVCALLGVPTPFPMEGKPLRPIVRPES